MKRSLAKIVYTPLNVLLYMTFHEGCHLLFLAIFGEFSGIEILWNGSIPAGMRVVEKAGAEGRLSGVEAALISGMSALIGLSIGYLLLSGRRFFASKGHFVRAMFFQLTIFELLLDPFNLSIGPFIYGGDINGISEGLGIQPAMIQVIFLAVLLINREIIARVLFSAYDESTTNILFVPWFGKFTRGDVKGKSEEIEDREIGDG